jgi:aminopeptidase I
MRINKEPQQAQETLSITDIHSKGFCDFLNDAPTVFHAVSHYTKKLEAAGYKHLAERDDWQNSLKPGGKYYLTRNGSSLVAFAVGGNYVPGNGIALIGSHIDALTMRVKPVSTKSSLGYLQLGVAPYAGGGNMTWWDRDLGLAGRVLVLDKATRAIKQHLVRLPYPVAKIPTLAPHFGAPSQPPYNPETNMTPIMGLEEQSAVKALEAQFNALGGNAPINDPTKNHAPRLLAAVAKQLSIDVSQIADLELELFDFQPAQPFGLDGELLSVPRCDDKLCSYAAAEALLNATNDSTFLQNSGCISMVYLADDEEVGSGLRQGAAGNTINITAERIVDVLNKDNKPRGNLVAMTFARSFFISADVKHALNPNVS